MEKGFGDLLGQSLKEYRDNFRIFFMLLLWLVFVPALIIFVVAMGLPDVSDIVNPVEALKILLSSPITFVLAVLGLLRIVLYLILSASLVYFVFYGKKAMSHSEAIRGGLNYFWRYVGLSIVSLFLLFLLFLLLVIPGIIFFVYWIFASYILIGENRGIWESLKESKKLVKGRWWKVFGYTLLLALIMIIIYFILAIPSVLFGFLIPEGNIFVSVLSLILNWISSLLTVPLIILFVKNFYLDLKRSKR